MGGNDLNRSNGNRQYKYYIKMTKIRTVTFLMMIISTCALILSLTDAYPTTEVTTASNATTNINDSSNNSAQFAITHVIKTIEFQVGILQDDDSDSDNTTDITTQEYIETDIKLLNVNLLRELLTRAAAEDPQKATMKSKEEEEKEGGSGPETNAQN